MKKIVLIFSVLVVFIACSRKVTNSSSGATTTSSVDKAKAESMYASDIKPVLEIKCAPCHFPDKGGFKAALDNFTAVSDHITDMYSRVQLDPSDPKYMPFKGKREALTATELAKFKAFKEALGK